MAEKRYSESDQRKIAQERFQKLKDKGCIDAPRITDVVPMHPQGINGALGEMLKDTNATQDQSQACIEHGKETLEQRKKESKEQMERKQEARKKGSYD